MKRQTAWVHLELMVDPKLISSVNIFHKHFFFVFYWESFFLIEKMHFPVIFPNTKCIYFAHHMHFLHFLPHIKLRLSHLDERTKYIYIFSSFCIFYISLFGGLHLASPIQLFSIRSLYIIYLFLVAVSLQ